MAKPFKLIAVSAVILAVLVAVLVIISKPGDEVTAENDILYITNRRIDEISEINITNGFDEINVYNEHGEYIIKDLPANRINKDYIQMLLDESSQIIYTDIADENPKDIGIYGLDKPEAIINVRYKDSSQVTLFIGDAEPVSNGRYVMAEGDSRVLLMKQSRTIRFTMPKSKYIDYLITPGCDKNSVLRIIKKITLSGEKLPEDIVITAIDENSSEDMRLASSFGVATHIVKSPGLHEVSQTQFIQILGSLMGLISGGVLDYNCKVEELSQYGFDKPWLKAEFTYQMTKDDEPIDVVLRVAKYNGDLIVTRDNDGIVYKLAGSEFDGVIYEKLVMRWFYTPFITDLSEMEIVFDNKAYNFAFSGEDNRSLSVAVNGEPLDIELFRKYYSLVISASHDGERVLEEPQGESVFTVKFVYKDSQKPNDILKLYNGGVRRVAVSTNDRFEFLMRQSYVEYVKKATEALLNGQDFPVEW